MVAVSLGCLIFEKAHAVWARGSLLMIWRAGRWLITTLGWNHENSAKTRVFENVPTVEARSAFAGLGVAFPHLATPSHEGGLYTLGVRSHAASLHF